MANKKCPVAKKCSGCQLSNMTYEQQLEWKQKDTEKLLGSFGKVSEIIGADLSLIHISEPTRRS